MSKKLFRKNHMRKSALVLSLNFILLTFIKVLPQSRDGISISLNETTFRTQPDYVDAIKKLGIENKNEFLLAAMNICSSISYIEESLSGMDLIIENEKRKYASEIPCCYTIIPPGYLDPYETYMFVVNGDNTILMNSNNPFKIKEIRDSNKYKTQVERIKKAASSANPNLIKYYSMQAIASKYNFASKKLTVSFSTLFFGLLGATLPAENRMAGTFEIDMPEDKAKKIFDFYEKNSTTKENGYKKGFQRKMNSINAVVTYSIQPGRFSSFDITPEKVEFFSFDGWKNKVGEVIF